MVTLAEQAISSELQIEARRDRFQEQLGAFEVRFGVVDVVRMLEKKSGDSKASFDLHDWEEGDLALANGFQTLHRLPNLPLLFTQQPNHPPISHSKVKIAPQTSLEAALPWCEHYDPLDYRSWNFGCQSMGFLIISL